MHICIFIHIYDLQVFNPECYNIHTNCKKKPLFCFDKGPPLPLGLHLTVGLLLYLGAFYWCLGIKCGSGLHSAKYTLTFVINYLCFLQISIPKKWILASLVAQWLRISLPMQGTWVRALVREDPTCRGTTRSMHHNY